MVTDKLIHLDVGFVVVHDNDYLNQMDGKVLLHVDDHLNQMAYIHLDKNITDQFKFRNLFMYKFCL
jgi:hypothetical protein